MNHNVIGLDIAKHVFHLYTIQSDGKVFKKMLKRQEVLVFFANYPNSLIGIGGLRQFPLLGEKVE